MLQTGTSVRPVQANTKHWANTFRDEVLAPGWALNFWALGVTASNNGEMTVVAGGVEAVGESKRLSCAVVHEAGGCEGWEDKADVCIGKQYILHNNKLTEKRGPLSIQNYRFQ